MSKESRGSGQENISPAGRRDGQEIAYNTSKDGPASAHSASLNASSSTGTRQHGHEGGKPFSADRVRPVIGEPPQARRLHVSTDPVHVAPSITPRPIRHSPLSPEAGPSALPQFHKRQSRDRGYSLRRTLFSRNTETSQHGSVMEMEPPGAPSSSKTTDHEDRREKKDQSNITISAAEVEEDAASDRPVPLPDIPTRSSSGHFAWLSARTSQLSLLRKLTHAYKTAQRRLNGMNELPPTASGRHIDLNLNSDDPLVDERIGGSYISNYIRSSRYTLLNFFPRQLFAQFSKLANFYFLTVSILQMIPGLSTTGTYTTIVPLLIFVGISMAKEGYDDIRRYRLDKEENNRETLVLDRQQHYGGDKDSWRATKWQDVKVGDVLLLQRDCAAPADLALLHAQGMSETAYIETMALDGETNLKSKRAVKQIADSCQSLQALRATTARFTVEDPNIDLYKFDGKVSIGGETIPLTNNEIVYRGVTLRNTREATALVIYTGEECKIRMNANKNPRTKAPTLQKLVNRVVIVIAIYVVSLAIFMSVAYEIWSAKVESHAWYLRFAKVAFGQIFVSFIILFNTLLPLSLYVSLEIVKVCQMFLMNDVDMYDEISNTPMEARTSTINEELGQVSYIFSDKTGTLTDNSMQFRKMSFAGTAWLHDEDLQHEAGPSKQMTLHKKRKNKGKGAKARKSSQPFSPESTREVSPPADPNPPRFADGRRSVPSVRSRPQASLYIGRSDEMLLYMTRKPHTVFARKARFFLLSLAVCHTCIPEKDEDGNITYQAASPDELALVTAAQDLGYVVVSREPNAVTIKLVSGGTSGDPAYETYKILDVIEFSSARKRMSIIVRTPDQRVLIVTKGADSTITGLLRLSDMASTFVAEIESQNHQRKSLEAQEVLRRRSIQVHRTGSLPRQSSTLVRGSVGGVHRASSTTGRKQSIREDVDHWLKERETDVNMKSPRDSTQYYTPRLSGPVLSPRLSNNRTPLTASEGRGSLQADAEEGLVDEALVIDDRLVLERCYQHINDFATEGLRTLMYGYRFIPEEEYKSWKESYLQATTSLIDRQVMIEKAAEQIEKQLELVGATAIEDKLQSGVPDTIDRLRRAGIKLWMLTGDKRETAINIGHSCRLVKDYSTIVILDHEQGQVDQRITQALADLRSGNNAHTVIVVDGHTLGLIDAKPEVKTLFLSLAIEVDSVICCRASPSQKASLVKAVRTKVAGSVTLAVGDGANDIAMIQEAHLGIGITGKEGLQAARSSDYSIAQFRFLLKLLLVHGRWNYVRICKYTLGTFWKEFMFYTTQALYQRYNGYTGTSLYEPWSLSMFNTLFTSLPVIFMGIFEKDLSASTLLAAPELYTLGQHNRGFNVKIYLRWTLMATLEALLIFFVSYAIFGSAPSFTPDNDLYALGALSFTCCVSAISLKLQVIELHNKANPAAVAVGLSVGGWFLWNVVLSLIYSTTSANSAIYHVKSSFLDAFGRNLLWWLTLIVVVLAFGLFEVTVKTAQAALWPSDVDAFQALERDREVRKRFEESAAVYLQQGWDRGAKDSSLELEREREKEREKERERKEKEQRQREAQIEDLLKRPRTMTTERQARDSAASADGVRKRNSWPAQVDGVEMEMEMEMSVREGEEQAQPKKSADVAELFSSGFGSVKRGQVLE